MNDFESLFVARDYVMNPEDDILLFDGTELKPGMVVLLESDHQKGDQKDLENAWSKKRYLESNRWCEVLRVQVQRRPEYDEHGQYLFEGSPLVHFTAQYPDGVVAKRTYDASFAWIVKKISMPTEE